MNKNLLKSIFIIILFLLVASASIVQAPQDKEKDLRKQILLETQKKMLIAEKRAYLLGKFEPALHKDFVKIPLKFTVAQNEMYLRVETFRAFIEMRLEAMRDGVALNIASATRNFDYQKNLWNNKWAGVTVVDGQNLSENFRDGLERFKKILEYSAAPGTSRHHWGTEIDINNANPSYFEGKLGEKEYEWLAQNAYRFSFCQTYDLRGSIRPTGYNEEKWHWSYLPLARVFMEEYKNLIKDEDIKGFLGDEYVPFLNLINDYILSINPDCI
ncbi:hypothetical protein A3A05_01585 [Candidatus Nomurabacteria bacterium RIFCSPLOWO2_01_FULL_41_12]|uniref:D-alanyl-D-alanine carboxypeptidase-like core domain-containing protein n=1 Tax=Candidatus Nomurabacteria bacterium RIFCSPLOWO2_01_FULL_41_12 TaxID=1801774 RepID=A0A1F6WW50_9BACT|nr:MAG: hypothetical protein A2732_00800 [Candidatus Nomurabacteria bacterium RIFCSPHIGHO2_01_FULL_40_10]OGI86090.1 MAG: hypothetical protein A3A05_01585 [Candidatus Nomurabacteria bacterium RIFCSPLOWO2_01_FULL_41_12]